MLSAAPPSRQEGPATARAGQGQAIMAGAIVGVPEAVPSMGVHRTQVFAWFPRLSGRACTQSRPPKREATAHGERPPLPMLGGPPRRVSSMGTRSIRLTSAGQTVAYELLVGDPTL